MKTLKKTEGRDWRDSLATKVVAYTLTGALVFGAGKLYSEMGRKISQENCERYGWLINYPKEIQGREIMRDLENRYALFRYPRPLGISQHIKDLGVHYIVKDLEKNCK